METKEMIYKQKSIEDRARLKKQKRTRQIFLQLVSSAGIVLVIVAAFWINLFIINAKASPQQKDMAYYKYYTSVTVEAGETLWDIAQVYVNGDHASMQKYIDEVKQINHLVNDKIYAGEDLIVPYYSDEYKR